MSIHVTSTTDSRVAINTAASDDRPPNTDPYNGITVWSTSDTREEKQAAANPEPDLGRVVVTSTTDSQAKVDATSVVYADTEAIPAEHITPITSSEDGRVATTTDSEETVAAVQREMEAERAEKTDYWGRNSAKKRIDR